MIVDQLFTPKLIREGEVYDLDKEYGAPAPKKKQKSQDPSDHNPYPYSREEDDDYFREIFRKKREAKAKEQDKLNEARLLEDPVYRDFKRVGRYIAEQKLTEPEILQIFSDAETGMTDKATGANRTFAGKGKDATVDFAKDVAGAVNGVLNSIQNSVPVAAVDTAYDQATDALGDLAGGQKGAVMDAIKKYRNLVKQYPKTAGFAKAALVAIAGLATGGAGLPAIAGLTYALDSAIKGDKLSSVLGKGAGAAALAAAGQAIHGGATQPSTGGPADTNAFTNVNQMGDHTGEYVNMPDGSDIVSPLVAPPPELATYTVQSGDTLSQIAQANDTTVQELVGLNPQLAAASGASGGQGLNPDVIFPGQQIALPPATPGADVYAGGVGTNANTMADIAKGQVPDSAISQGMAAKGQASANAVGDNIDKASNPSAASDFGTGGNAPIDYTSPGPESADSLGQKLEYGIPVNDKGSFVPPNPNLPPEELATQQAAYNSWKSDFMRRFPNASPGPDGSMLSFKPGLNTMQIFNKPTLPASVQESVKFKRIPASRLIDQKATVLNWALCESVGRPAKSVNLTTLGTYTVFENIDRYRLALVERAETQPMTQPGRPELPDQYRPDMPGGAGVQSQPGMIGRGLNWLDKKAKAVGGALSNFGHQFTTNVTKEKLKMNWHQAGKPSDSDQLATWLIGQGVPQEVVTSVYGKMGIPYTAPAAEPTAQPGAQTAAPAKTGGAQRQAYAGTNPATGKPWTVDELQARMSPAPTTPSTTTATTSTAPTTTAPATTAAGKFPGEDPQGPGYVGRREAARRQAARDAEVAKKPAVPNFAQQGGGYKSVNYAPNIKTGVNLPKPTSPAAPTATASKGGLDKKTQDYINAINAKQPASLAENRIAIALKKPVAEMLQMVETKEDVQRIKQFVDETFVRYGVVNESAFAVRNQILEHVTQVGAQRRREHSQRVAT
jgi:LysM repeat protein